jgi:hypothetical protein
MLTALTEQVFDGRSYILGLSAIILWLSLILVLDLSSIMHNSLSTSKTMLLLVICVSLFFIFPAWFHSYHKIASKRFLLPKFNPHFVIVVYASTFMAMAYSFLRAVDFLFLPLKINIGMHFFLVLSSFLIFLIAGEFIFIANNNFGLNSWEIYDTDPTKTAFVWKGHFGDKREFSNKIVLNNYGFWDRNWVIEKKPGLKRIIMLGDSFVESYQVSLNNSVHKRLEAILKESKENVEVLGMARSGNGTVEEERLLCNRALSFNPDLIILCFTPMNDVRNAQEILQTRAMKEAEFRLNKTPIYYLSHFYRLSFLGWIIYKMDRFTAKLRYYDKIPTDNFVYTSVPIDGDWMMGWQNIQDSLKRMYDACKRNKIRFAVISMSSPEQIAAFSNAKNLKTYVAGLPKLRNAKWDFTEPDNRIEHFCKLNQIPVLILSKRFIALSYEEGTKIHWSSDRHWSDLGHDLGAKAIADFIHREDLLN